MEKSEKSGSMAAGYVEMINDFTEEFLFEQAYLVRNIVAKYIRDNARNEDEAFLADYLRVFDDHDNPVICVEDNIKAPSGKPLETVLDEIEFGNIDEKALFLFRKLFLHNGIR